MVFLVNCSLILFSGCFKDNMMEMESVVVNSWNLRGCLVVVVVGGE